jgi:hypothetical protein
MREKENNIFRFEKIVSSGAKNYKWKIFCDIKFKLIYIILIIIKLILI